jgi:GNAT superfamily N-acetyltransferase
MLRSAAPVSVQKRPQLEFEKVAPSHRVASSLIRELDEELARRYPVESIHGLHPDEMVTFPGIFLLARYQGEVVACGAVRPLDAGLAELKRMYVVPSARRRGFARRLLEELEQVARDLDVRVLRLETGVHQPESVALYEGAGYRQIALYGEYIGNSYSLCYEKLLVP